MVEPRSPDVSPHPGSLTSGVALVLLLLAGFLLRFHALESKSLWRDELETLAISSNGYRDVTRLAMELPVIPVPPLNFYLTRLICFQLLPGISLRVPAALFGGLLPATVWLAGRRMLGPAAALTAAAMTAFSPFLLRYSQEARAYALLALLVTLSAFLLSRAAGEGRRRDWAAFAVTAVLAIYTHFFAFLWAAAAFLHCLSGPLSRRGKAGGPDGAPPAAGRRRDAWAAWLVILTACLPLVGPLSRGLRGARGLDLEAMEPNLRLADLPAVAGVMGPASFPWSWAVAGLVCLGAAAGPWRRGGRRLALLWLTVPVILAAMVPFRHELRLRYLIFVLPAWYLLAAAGLAVLAGRVRGRRAGMLAAAGLFVAVMASAAGGLRAYWREGKQDWRSAALLLERAIGPGDVILVDGRGAPGVNLRRLAMEHYASLGDRVRLAPAAADDPSWRRVTPSGTGRLWRIKVLAEDRPALGAALVPVPPGWMALPAVKLDAPADLSPAERRWMDPVRFRSLLVIPLVREPSKAGRPETERLLELARALPGAVVDESFTARLAGAGSAGVAGEGHAAHP